MAEDEGSDDDNKTEEPTARKLEEAHKRGQVVNSREVNNWIVLFASTLMVLTVGDSIADSLRELFRNFLEQSYQIPDDKAGMGEALATLFLRAGAIILLPLLIMSFAGGLSGFLQTGPLFTLEPLKPDLSKISLMKGIGRVFSKRGLMELAKGIVKIGVVGTAIYMVLRPYLDGIEHFVGLDVGQGLFEMRALFMKMMIAVLSILFILAVGDYVYQRSEFMKNMRMSKQEIRDEYKQTEGDPHIKGRLRALREQKARQRMMQAVPTADVVITNPTHYAVALKYDPTKMQAPVMVAKGVDDMAQRIRAVARENEVPVVENPPLARALFASMEIDQAIPGDQYKAVAEVISYVFKLKGRKMS